MATSKTLRSIFSLILLSATITTLAQTTEWKGLSVGTDLSRFVVPFIDSTRYGWEVSGDYEIIKDVFGVVEIGSQTTRFQAPQYSYNSAGAYTRLGVDYNYMKHLDPESTDQLLIGLRYGFTTFSHKASQITIHDEYWGDFTNGSIPNHFLSDNWLEVATGMRAQLFNNFYLAWSVRFRVNLWQQKDDQLQPYYIPGFGRAWNNSWLGLNYSIYYRIPIYKKKADSEK